MQQGLDSDLTLLGTRLPAQHEPLTGHADIEVVDRQFGYPQPVDQVAPVDEPHSPVALGHHRLRSGQRQAGNDRRQHLGAGRVAVYPSVARQHTHVVVETR